MKPIHKFNNGNGATLCNQCSVIISVGLTDDLYCKDCRKEMLQDIMKNDEELGLYEKPKQETLEEVAKYYAHNYFEMHDTNNYKALKQGFEAGAKWQQEQDKKLYSEEDMQEYAEFCIRCDREGLPCIVVKDWFKEFKKK
jgi:hypothetical protein